MKEQWDELKETIIELRDNNGTATQQGVCKFLVKYMNVLESQIEQERKWRETMATPNEIAFSIEDYDGNETEMFAAIGKTLKILTKNGYICTFSCDEPAFQTYVIEFDYEDEALAVVKPYWLTPEQMEKLQDLEDEEADKAEETKGD